MENNEKEKEEKHCPLCGLIIKEGDWCVSCDVPAVPIKICDY